MAASVPTAGRHAAMLTCAALASNVGAAMYLSHFGLREAPFAITPDPRYLYMSERHREALAHLLYGVGEGGGFVQLTGEVGTGKTTVCRCPWSSCLPGWTWPWSSTRA